MTTKPKAYMAKPGQLERVEHYVWCQHHGLVHEDTTNPYDCPDDRCTRQDHRLLYQRHRAGDYLENVQ